MTIHELIREQVDLAVTYAEDGAFHTAARVLDTLAENVRSHAEECDRLFTELHGN